MKNIKYVNILFGWLCVAMFVACEKSSVDMPVEFCEAVHHAEKDWRYAKFARGVLKRLSVDTLQMSLSQRMYFKLKETYVNDRVADTCIAMDKTKQLVDYYESNGPDSLYMEAMYYMGGAYRDQKDYPQAIYWYNKAQCVAEENAELGKLDLYTRICLQEGELYNNLYLGRKSITAYQKALNGNKNQYIPYIYEGLGFAYSNVDKPDSALYYFEKVYNTHLTSDEKKDKMKNSIMNVLYKIGNDEEIKKFSYGLLSQEAPEDSPSYYALLFAKGQYSLYIGDANAASKFLVESCKTNDDYQKAEAYKLLLSISIKKKSINDMEKYAQLYQQQMDSIFRYTESNIASQTENFYNYQFQQEKRLEAEFKEKILTFICYIGLIVVLLVMALGGYKFIKDKRKLKVKVYQYENEIDKLTSDLEEEQTNLAKLQLQIDNGNQEIEELRKQVEKHQQNTAGLQNLLVKIQMRRKDSFLDLREKLSNQSVSLDRNLWFAIKQALRITYPNLENNIKKQMGTLSDFDQRYVYLLCFNLRDANIARLLSVSPQNLWGHKKRLYTRLTGKKKFDKDQFGKLIEDLMN